MNAIKSAVDALNEEIVKLVSARDMLLQLNGEKPAKVVMERNRITNRRPKAPRGQWFPRIAEVLKHGEMTAPQVAKHFKPRERALAVKAVARLASHGQLLSKGTGRKHRYSLPVRGRVVIEK